LDHQTALLQAEILSHTEALQEQKNFLYQIINSIPAIIWWKNNEQAIAGGNHAALQLFGLHHFHELIGKCYAHFPASAQIHAWEEIENRVLTDGTNRLHSVEEVVYPDGSVRWMEINRVVLHDAWGEKNSILIVGCDISKRKRAEQNLLASEQRYRELFTNNKAVKLLIDVQAQGNIVDANQAAVDFYGYPQERLKRMKISDINILTPEEICHEMARAKQQQRTHFYFKHKLASGEVRDVEVHSGPVNQGGRVLLYSIIHDITERRQAEKILHTQYARLRALTEIAASSETNLSQLLQRALEVGMKHLQMQSGDIAQWRDKTCVILYQCGFEEGTPCCQNPIADQQLIEVHRQFMDQAGYDNNGFIGAPLLVFGTRFGSVCFHGSAQQGFDVADYDFVKLLASWIGAMMEREQTAEHLKEAKEKAEAGDRAKSAFLANMSHELRTPLHNILGNAQLLRDYHLQDAWSQQQVGLIIRGGEHLLSLINHVLDLSKIEADGLTLHPNEFSLRVLLDEVRNLFELHARQQNLRFICEPLPGTPQSAQLPALVYADERRLRQILSNLLSNALKYTTQGEVRLSLNVIKNQEDNTTQLYAAVHDTGQGIIAERLTSLFQAFEHTHNHQLYSNGCGLGLAITHNLIQRMGGELQVQSAPGKGSMFWFKIPLQIVLGAAASSVPNTICGYHGLQRNILLVNDPPLNALLTTWLQPLDFGLAQASNGEQALTILETFIPDIVLMEVTSPINRVSWVQKMRTRDLEHAIIIIGLSDPISPEMRQQYLATQYAEIIEKPLKQKALFSALSDVGNIQWIEQSQAATTLLPQAEILLPSAEEVSELFKQAKLGRIHVLQQQLKQLVASNPKLAPFCNHLLTLSQQFKLKELKSFLRSYQAE